VQNCVIVSSGGSRIFERGRAGIERRRHEDRGAEAGVVEQFFFSFYLEIALFGAFWSVFKVYIPICACQFCDPKSDSLYGLITKDISYNRPYASGQLHVGYLHKVQISKKILILLLIIKSLMRKTSYLHAGVERENFKIDCHILFGVGPADTMPVDYTQACCNVCMQGLLTLAVLALSGRPYPSWPDPVIPWSEMSLHSSATGPLYWTWSSN